MSKRSGSRCARPTRAGRRAGALLCTGLAVLIAGCGGDSSLVPRALLREARPVGVGPRFQPGIQGRVVGRCEQTLGRRYAVHVEVFAANRVVIIPAGIGTKAPREVQDGQVIRARCYGALVTLAPTGVVLIRDGVSLRLGRLFRAWGEPFSPVRLASFSAPARAHVSVFIDGRRWHGAPRAVRLRRHAEIVLEVGPYVPPHRSFAFPPGE